MGNVGLKIAQSGIDVTKAGDNQLIYSSSFKLPLVVFQGTKRIVSDPSFPTTQTVFTHNLGYVPVFISFVRDITDNQTNIINLTKMNNYDLVIRREAADNTVEVTYFIFNIPLLIDYTAPVFKLTGIQRGSINKNIGFKIAKSGKNVLNATLNDLQIFSGSSLADNPVRNQIIHKVVSTNVARGTTKIIKHGLNYKPMTIFYLQEISSLRWLALDTGYVFNILSSEFEEYLRAWIDQENINIRNGSNGFNDPEPVITVIFKDPLL